MSRARRTHIFLWIAVLGWGVGFGAKLFDLLVLASAWGRSAPSSLALYPYGKNWPVDPGNFFQPLSAVMVIGIVGALVSGWKTPPAYRVWLWVPVVAFALIWIATPTMFWPLISELYAIAHGREMRTDAETMGLVRRWFVLDWCRVAVIGAGWVASIGAISLPFPGQVSGSVAGQGGR